MKKYIIVDESETGQKNWEKKVDTFNRCRCFGDNEFGDTHFPHTGDIVKDDMGIAYKIVLLQYLFDKDGPVLEYLIKRINVDGSLKSITANLT